MTVHPDVARRFLNATQSNWRSTIYIECRTCTCKPRPVGCGDFLFAPEGRGGAPILLPVPDAEFLFGRVLDRSECLMTCSTGVFLALFSQWAGLPPEGAAAPGLCPLLKRVSGQYCPENW